MKAFGDKHFMIDEALLERIVDYGNVRKTDVVLEIGGGAGNLTARILKRAKKVHVFEKDPELCEVLRERFGKRIELVEGDALKLKFPKFDKVISNIPYSISRKITEKILKHKFKVGVLVYQREFAKKLAANTGNDDYRFISALVQSVSGVELLEDISPTAFEPMPNVWSSVVRIKPKTKADDDYINFLRDMFNHKNKKLRNILEEKVPEKYENKRPFELTPEELQKLYFSG